MQQDEPQVEAPDEKKRKAPYTVYNPVSVDVDESVGAIFLGIITLVLLIAFLRSEARNRRLTAQLYERGQDQS